MSKKEKVKKGIVPIAWLLYLLIVFEIIYMISPFAFYYYSAYGPGLNFLQNWSITAWLSAFFLPHFTESSSWILGFLHGLGWQLFLVGFAVFLIGAGQIYYAKFSKKGAVTGGLYKFVRNPQYTAFSIMDWVYFLYGRGSWS
jgi:protein-S-isoprenylcysteine O-methyltransferase Ste14